MLRKQNIKPLSELNLAERFLFDEVVEDSQTHQDMLSIVLGRQVALLEKNETEKEFRTVPEARSVRMDVFAVDEEQIVYNTEMQGKKRKDLAKRSRYYQSLIDASLLNPGIPSYDLLNESYIIIIMTFDIFGEGKYQYTYVPICKETGRTLQDGTTRIFLNTKGTNEEEVSKELVEFLHYVENSTQEQAEKCESERVRRIHNRVCKVRSSEEIGVKYMQAWEERYYEKQESREEGEWIKLIKQVCKKIRKQNTVAEIAEMLDEEEFVVQSIYDVASHFAPEYDAEDIFDEWAETSGIYHTEDD